MKPANFEYYDPSTIDEALALLSQYGDEARPLAGGQSLVPLMNFRLLRPAHIIDLNGIAALNFLQADAGELRIGATTRQRQLERSSEVGARWPLLRDATSYIGHAQIRNRGTVGGSLAHAFPSAELPIAMVTLGASFVLRAKSEQRTVAADGFFLSFMTSALQLGELLVEIKVPALAPNTGWSYQEVSRRHGDFALAGAASLVTLDAAGIITHAKLTLTGTTPMPSTSAQELMLGQKPSESLFRESARRVCVDLVQDSDIHASAEYRRSACEILARRALTEAAQRATQLIKGMTR
jgi:CO/xanthine dehydrogenase FAD-binding subunit